MVDRDVFNRRLAKLEELLRKLRRLAGEGRERYRSEETLRASAERWLHLASECALDLAHHLIADRGWKTPSTYRETFQILEKEGVLSSELAARLEQWAGLRNVLVHLYLEVDQERLYDIIDHDLVDLERFAAVLSRTAGSAG